LSIFLLHLSNCLVACTSLGLCKDNFSLELLVVQLKWSPIPHVIFISYIVCHINMLNMVI
jgi:hypothetical protein